MSGPPPNFNANDSMLPDPGQNAAPIHVMRGGGVNPLLQNETNEQSGGGGGYTENETKILAQYGLDTGGPIYEAIDDKTKRKFLEQLDKCKIGTGSSIILHKNCSAVLAVIRALIKAGIKRANSRDISKYENMNEVSVTADKSDKSNTNSEFGPDDLSDASKASASSETSSSNEAPPPSEPTSSEPTPSDNLTNTNRMDNKNNTPFGTPSSNLFTVNTREAVSPLSPPAFDEELLQSTNVEFDPINFKENVAGRSAVNINLTRKNKRFVSNLKLNGRKTRIRGQMPSDILKRYNYENQLLTTNRELRNRSTKNAAKRALEEQRSKEFTARKKVESAKQRTVAEERKYKKEVEEAQKQLEKALTKKQAALGQLTKAEQELQTAVPPRAPNLVPTTVTPATQPKKKGFLKSLFTRKKGGNKTRKSRRYSRK
jgi:hypothetical protein